MREMKDIGAGWLGQVPVQWKSDKLKYHLKRSEPRNPGGKTVLSLYRELGVLPKDSRDDNYNVTSEDTSNYKYVRPGDFVVNKMKAWQGSVAVSMYEGIVSPAYFVYHFTDSLFYKQYFHYLMRGCYKDEFMRLSGGIRVGQWDLPAAALENTIVLIPPLEEQHLIATYLDRKCAEIDALTEDIETQIETLEQYKRSVITEAVTKGLDPGAEMKDSGVEWIGKMPAAWGIIKIKYLSRTRNVSRAFDPEVDNYIGLENVQSYENNVLPSDSQYEASIQRVCCKGDVMFGKLRPYLAKVIIAPFNGFCTGEFLQLSQFKGDKRFLRYFMLSDGFIEHVNASTYGAKMPRANTEFIINLVMTYPAMEEQKNVCDYLDCKCVEIDDIITSKHTQLETLTEYKKSLIYEYVTGKKEVPTA